MEFRPGLVYEVSVRRQPAHHVPDQRKLAHALIGEIAEYVGEPKPRMKEMLKKMLIMERFVPAGDDVELVRPDTSELDCEEASEFIGHLEAIAGWLGIEIGAAPDLKRVA